MSSYGLVGQNQKVFAVATNDEYHSIINLNRKFSFKM